jgi:hypothetical protein
LPNRSRLARRPGRRPPERGLEQPQVREIASRIIAIADPRHHTQARAITAVGIADLGDDDAANASRHHSRSDR